MKVTVQVDVFGEACNTAALGALLYVVARRRHHLTIENDRDERFLAWLAGLQPAHRQQWTDAIANAYRREALEPASRAIRVSETTTDWDASIPVVTVEQAVDYLNEPFRILLEDHVSDRNFLFKMATEDQRDYLVARLDDGSLVIDNGGGISSMPRRVDEIAEGGRRSALLNWVMFDSDALQPEMPSEQSLALERECARAKVPYHRLRRRNIENYLTKNCLRVWAYENRRSRENCYHSLLKLSDIQWCHYNFKEGFKGDEQKAPPAAGSLFDGLPTEVVRHLHLGLGKKIGALFASGMIAERDLKRDGAWEEMNPVVSSLIALAR